MNNEKSAGHPYLHLTFAGTGEKAVLVDAEFRLNESHAINRELVAKPMRGKYVRAACIALLLAKYRGENFVKHFRKEPCIVFRDKKDRPSWIKSFSNALAKHVQQKFLEECFSGCLFFSASRGTQSGKNGQPGALPVIRFLPERLPPQNLRFFKCDTVGGKRIAMTDEEPANFATWLESQESEWESILPEMIADTERDRPLKSSPEKSLSKQENDRQPCMVWARWRELSELARVEAKRQLRGGNWYVVCVTPSWIMDWKSTFCDAIRHHKANIKFAYHSPTAGKNCPSVRAQWRMHVESIKPKAQDGADYVRGRLQSLKKEMGTWAGEMQAKTGNPSAGGFEFYESRVTHPYMAILFVPTTSRPTAGAPVGTWCIVQLYVLYPVGVDERCGLYLNQPSPMLDVYYNSITTFFERGETDDYLTPVNL